MNAPTSISSVHGSDQISDQISGQDEFDLLNQDQQKAVSEIFRFLMSSEKEFMISGPAGTGKTHLMKYVMRHTLPNYRRACELLGQRYIDFTIQLTATTNKAAAVLSASTGYPADTVHSFLNLKVRDNYETGATEIRPTPNWQVHERTLVFIDEASMVDAALHDYIRKGTDRTCKIIYLGDHCQMAPVFETISPVYANPTNFAELKQPMRNAGQPALMALCTQLRDTVESLQFKPIDLVLGVIDHLDDQQAYDFVEQTFAAENPSARILAYSNQRVQEYNAHIRALRRYPDTFVAGEVLINNSAFQSRNGRGKNAPTRLFAIEDEIEILEVSDTVDAIKADANDASTAFEIYHVRFRKRGVNECFSAAIPRNPQLFKELTQHFARAKNWDRYFWLKNNFPDFRLKDAATVYKAQGSTHHTVFLDLSNIGTCKHNDQLARMLYVGASRATDRVVIYGALPARLFA